MTYAERIVDDICRRFLDAREKAEKSEAIAHNSYGAGFDRGYSDALGELLEHITGDAAQAVAGRTPQETSGANANSPAICEGKNG